LRLFLRRWKKHETRYENKNGKNNKKIVKEQKEVVSEFYMSARRSQWQSSEGDAVSK
jgi:hypothetical protein